MIGMRWGVFGARAAECSLSVHPLLAFAHEMGGLALFAVLMGFVECATHCPLMFSAEGKQTWDAAQARPGALRIGRWEDLSEAMRQHWMSMLISTALGPLDEVLR